MQLSVIAYTVGIKRRFLPGFRKYTVTYHDTDEHMRLHMQLTDGSQIVVPGLHRQALKVYPDYRNAEIQLSKLRAAQAAPSAPAPVAVPVAPVVEDGAFEALLNQRRAAQAGG